MKLVIQRTNKASVKNKETGKIVGSIKKGLFVLVGVGPEDTRERVDLMVQKLLKLRIMADANQKMNLSIKDVNAEVLVVSQFTLFADTAKGNRPSFVKAAKPELAEKLYEYFVEEIEKQGVKVSIGTFGAYMEIKAELDGPVTILINN